MPVVPVALVGHVGVVSERARTARPGCIRLVLGVPIPTEGLGRGEAGALAERVRATEQKLIAVESRRAQGRRRRQRGQVRTVSLVGYTNAGKSTLFNAITGAGVYAADQLFATLDPTMRRVDLPDSLAMVLADTVGFVRHLPHQLVEAFRATLEEARLADLLVHVIDASAEDRDDTTHEVEHVLAEIGAEEVPRLDVFNKIDLLEASPRIDRDETGRPVRVWVSAKSGAGLELLREAIAERIGGDMAHEHLALSPSEGRLRAILYGRGAVVAEDVAEDGTLDIEVRLPRRDLEQLLRDRQ